MTTTPAPVEIPNAEEIIEAVRTTDAQTALMNTGDFFLRYGPTMLAAVCSLVIGLILTRVIMHFLRKITAMNTKADPAVVKFTLSVVNAVLYIFVGLVTVTILIPQALGAMVAALSVLGLSVSLAVKDSLANLAGGIMVLFTKPFSLGDYVAVDGIEGMVEEVRLNYTILKTVDNKLVHIPNGDVAKAKTTNFSAQVQRRLDLRFSIAYENDFRQAQKIILDCVTNHALAKQDPAPVVRLLEHGDSALVLCCRVWVDTGEYWNLYFDLMEQVKLAFDDHGISIPYNQMDVHIISPEKTLA